MIHKAYKIDREALAWAAGFFDGEGCIGCYYRTNGKTQKRYRLLHISVGQKDREVLDRFKAIFGFGRIVQTQKNNGPFYHFAVDSFEKSQAIVAMLFPFLGTIKQQQISQSLAEYHKNLHPSNGG